MNWQEEFDKKFKCPCLLCVEGEHELTTTAKAIKDFIVSVVLGECIECGKQIDIKAGEEVTPQIGKLASDYGNVELCRSCFSKDWSEATPEDFNKDGFTSLTESPIQQKDL